MTRSICPSPRILRLIGGVLCCLLWLVEDSVPARADQPVMQTIFTNGPVSNRLNIVILSEGYMTNQLPQFLIDATNAAYTLLSHPPYQEYSNYCNAYSIRVASVQSGSDHNGSTVNTYFNSAYDISDTLITIPTNNTGQGKIDGILSTNLPRYHLAILLVNDSAPGGSDGFDKTAIVSTGAMNTESALQQPWILSHETGHVLANLGDEYTNAYPGFPNIEEPNTTRETNRILIKWTAWISTDTPIPTPISYDDTVGLFQGAHYHPTNWYRPKLNCAMRVIGWPFCEVCSEALTLAIYQRVRPVDGFTPAGTNIITTTNQLLSFSVTPLQPMTHNLSVQWYTNGVAQNGATNTTFSVLPLSLGAGSNWVRAVVKDNTPYVRNDPTNLLSQSVTWGVSVNITQLRLDSTAWLPSGKFKFRVTGYSPSNVAIYSSTNLLSWTSLSTNSLASGQFWYTNANASNSVKKFFRAITPP